jgi:prephenate dehydrogenase
VRLAVLGVGLIGGSIGLAARERLGAEVVGWDPGPGVLDAALDVGALDRAAPDAAAALEGAEAAFVAAPVGALPAAVADALAAAGEDCVVSDVGSTKRVVVEAVRDERFIGGHPLAGAETAGVPHARAALFDGATWYLTPTATTRGTLYERLHRLLSGLGATPAAVDADTHDRMLATVSHLPHVLANVLVGQAAHASWGEAWPQRLGGQSHSQRLGGQSHSQRLRGQSHSQRGSSPSAVPEAGLSPPSAVPEAGLSPPPAAPEAGLSPSALSPSPLPPSPQPPRLPATGPSFRDITRVAGANTAIWRDIYLANADALIDAIDDATARLGAVRAALEQRDGAAVAEWNDGAREDRRTLLEDDLAGGTVAELRVSVPNRPGVVADVALALGRGGVNILDMALHPAPDRSSGYIVLWIAGEERAAQAEALVAGLGLPVARA